MSIYRVRPVLLLSADFFPVYKVVCISLPRWHHISWRYTLTFGSYLILIECHCHLRSLCTTWASYPTNHIHTNCMMIIIHIKNLLMLSIQICRHLVGNSRDIGTLSVIHVGKSHSSWYEYIVVFTLRTLILPTASNLLWIVLTL